MSLQIRSLSHRRRILSGDNYIDRILALEPISYWPLDEASGATARCLISSAQNGSAVGITWANDITGPFGTPAPFFDGTNDYIDIYTAAFVAAFDGAVGSAAAWCKVFNAGVWTDAQNRYVFTLRSGFDNQHLIGRSTSDNALFAALKAGGSQAGLSYIPYSETGWFHLAMTWSDSNNADEAKLYVNGVLQDGPDAGMDAWAGALNSSYTKIGAFSNTPDRLWYGWLGHPATWDRVLTAGEVALAAAAA